MNPRPVVRARTGTRIGRLSLLVVAAWLSTTPAFAQYKPRNFGGIPKPLLDLTVGVFSGALAPGITPGMAADVLVRLIQEEHAAANPGPGVTGFIDAFTRLNELKTALENVKKATAAEKPAKVKDLMDAIDHLGQLWLIGPVLPGFFTEDPRQDEGDRPPVPPLE